MQGAMQDLDKQGNKKPTDWFSVSLVAVVLVSVVVSLLVYKSVFGAGLSSKADTWSAFGSYIGGLFGPLISFLTLLAILKTIGLQKELLDTQRHEFDAMQRLQVETLASQLAQIERSNAEADRRLIEENRLNVLRTLENLTEGLQREYETKQRGFETVAQWMIDGKSVLDREKMTKLRGRLSNYESHLAALNILYSELCFNDFKDVASIKSHYQSEMERICGEWGLPDEDDAPPIVD